MIIMLLILLVLLLLFNVFIYINTNKLEESCLEYGFNNKYKIYFIVFYYFD